MTTRCMSWSIALVLLAPWTRAQEPGPAPATPPVVAAPSTPPVAAPTAAPEPAGSLVQSLVPREVRDVLVQLEPMRVRAAVDLGDEARTALRVGDGRFLGALAAADPEPKPSALVTGDYAAALERLDQARQAMATTEDIDAAMRSLNEAMKAIEAARAALWRQKDAADKRPTRDAR